MATTLPGLETHKNEIRQKMNRRVINTNIKKWTVSLKIRRKTISISKITSHFDAVKLATRCQLKVKVVSTFALERNIRERNFELPGGIERYPMTLYRQKDVPEFFN